MTIKQTSTVIMDCPACSDCITVTLSKTRKGLLPGNSASLHEHRIMNAVRSIAAGWKRGVITIPANLKEDMDCIVQNLVSLDTINRKRK